VLDIMLQATDSDPAVKLSFEHSLLSLSKWEAFYEKAFFGREAKSVEETEQYIRFMLLNDNHPENFFDRLSREDFEKISDYINSNQTATTFAAETQQRGPQELITNELIYYWLIQFNIPFHPVETWHLNRLMTLVKVVGVKQAKPKKMSKQELAEKYRTLNEQRRRESGTAG
jgi:hypothetical protein